jgi:glutamine synthetase
MWSSAYTCWGLDNREAAVRVASPFRARVEASTNLQIKPRRRLRARTWRSAGGGGHGGHSPRAGYREPLSSNPHDLRQSEREARGIRRYPTSLGQAIAELERDEVLLAALGDERAHEFLPCVGPSGRTWVGRQHPSRSPRNSGVTR